MFLQMDNTNFGKVGYNGGNILGRGKKLARKMAGSNYSNRLDSGAKAQIKQGYNSSVSEEGFDDICENFMEKSNLRHDKFVRRKQ